MPNSLFGRVENLDLFSVDGSLINTAPEIIEMTRQLYGPQVSEMTEEEPVDFIEGFLAGVMFCKSMELGRQLSVLSGDLSEEGSQEITEAQLDTVITLLAEYLQKRRDQN